MANLLPNPKIDVVFHSLFREGNEDITKALISAIINKPINNIDLSVDRVLVPRTPSEKLCILDLKAILEDNTICNIEVQLHNNHDIIPRLLYYWSRLYDSQLQKSQDYNLLQKTICIGILDYNLPEVPKSYPPHSIWKIMNTCDSSNDKVENFHKTILTNLFELHIIELPKVKKYLEQNPNDIIAQWMLFMSDVNNEEVVNVMRTNKEIREAMSKLEKITADKELMEIIEARDKAERDYISGMKNAERIGMERGMRRGRKHGIKEGRKEGKEEGLKEGINQTKIETAKNLLAENIDINIISKATGLLVEEIEKLKF